MDVNFFMFTSILIMYVLKLLGFIYVDKAALIIMVTPCIEMPLRFLLQEMNE